MGALKLRRTVTPIHRVADMAPLIDVVLLLLIFFLLSSSFVLQPGISIKAPQQRMQGGIAQARFIVAVGESSQVFFNDQVMEVGMLKNKFVELKKQFGDVPVVIKADRSTSHGMVVRILNDALEAGLEVVIAAASPEDEPNAP